MSSLLEMIDGPEDLKRLPEDQLESLAAEIRQRILDVISKSSGHFAPSLGVVELTLALHRVYETPRDRIVWDVGHQAYVHKIITGRRDRFPTIRKKGGLSGYCRRCESQYDAFGAGHASTSISAALGIAAARDLRGEDFRVIAVIGDGAMTGGMAWEAINNAGASGRELLVILNDNHMSISPNVGAFTKYFNSMIADDRYNRVKKNVWDMLGRFPLMGRPVREAISQLDQALKSLFVPGIVFEKLGMRYFGPIDGHNIRDLIGMLEQLKELKGPKILHVYTQKGKGVPYAEKDPYKWHASGGFDPKNGEMPKTASPPKYQDVLGKTLVALAPLYPDVVGITAAMASGTGLQDLADAYPERFFDVGIAEQHAVTFAAGLAAEGVKPIVAVYSTFLQRAFDQIVHDVCIQNLPVAFCLDRAGLVGDDGATHNGIFDITYLRQIPNMVVMAPKDEPELQRMLLTAIRYNGGPIAIRYPRGSGPGKPLIDDPGKIQPIEIGTWEQLRPGDDAVILAIGSMVHPALQARDDLAGEGVSVEVVNARFAKPLDDEMLDSLLAGHRNWLTIEENVLAGGFGSAVMEWIERRGALEAVNLSRMGIPDEFTDHGTREEVLEDVGLSRRNIAGAVRALIERHVETRTARSQTVASEPIE